MGYKKSETGNVSSNKDWIIKNFDECAEKCTNVSTCNAFAHKNENLCNILLERQFNGTKIRNFVLCNKGIDYYPLLFYNNKHIVGRLTASASIC